MSDLPSQLLKIARNIVMELRAISASLFAIHEKVEAIGKQKQPEKSTNDKPLSPIVSILTTPTAIEVQAETHDYKDTWQRLFEILELLGIAAVVAYAFLTYYQLKELRKSVDAAQETATFAYHQTIMAGRSLDAARVQATAAQDQVTVMRKQLQVTERPWIKAQSVMQKKITAGQKVTAEVSIVNVGKTPATRIFAVLMLDRLRNVDAPSNFFAKPPRLGMKGSDWFKSVYRPKATIYWGVLFPFDPETRIPVPWLGNIPTRIAEYQIPNESDVREFEEGKYYFITHGVIAYADSFGVDHWTQFCEWRGSDVPGIEYFHAGQCTQYNQTDDNR